MIYCNTADILDSAMTKWADNSTALRALALGWLNEVIREVLNQPRTWWFLKTGSTLTIAANAITIPSGVGQVLSIEGTDFFLTPADQMTDEEVYDLGDDTSDVPIGYTQTATTITFYPSATGNVTLRYEADVTADLADSTSDIIFPIAFRNLLICGVRAHYYDYDKDGRYGKEEALFGHHLALVKAWDNTLKPTIRQNPHGYTRVA